jgi:hypothetical protein
MARRQLRTRARTAREVVNPDSRASSHDAARNSMVYNAIHAICTAKTAISRLTGRGEPLRHLSAHVLRAHRESTQHTLRVNGTPHGVDHSRSTRFCSRARGRASTPSSFARTRPEYWEVPRRSFARMTRFAGEPSSPANHPLSLYDKRNAVSERRSDALASRCARAVSATLGTARSSPSGKSRAPTISPSPSFDVSSTVKR